MCIVPDVIKHLIFFLWAWTAFGPFQFKIKMWPNLSWIFLLRNVSLKQILICGTWLYLFACCHHVESAIIVPFFFFFYQCIDKYQLILLCKGATFPPSNPGHKRLTCLRDLLSSRAKAELMSVPDYNDPLRHTNLPSHHPSTASISRVRGDSRCMIDVCLWRNQEGAQINFSLSSFDFIWLIYFVHGLTNGQCENEPFRVENF